MSIRGRPLDYLASGGVALRGLRPHREIPTSRTRRMEGETNDTARSIGSLW